MLMTSTGWPKELTLEGRFVRLEPLTQAHGEAFLEAGAEWDFTPEFVREAIASSLRRRDEGTAIPFATVDKPSGRVAGGTSFLRINLSCVGRNSFWPLKPHVDREIP